MSVVFHPKTAQKSETSGINNRNNQFLAMGNIPGHQGQGEEGGGGQLQRQAGVAVQAAHHQVQAPNPHILFPQGIDQRPAPVRDFRPRRYIYSRAQKDRAVRLLNMGIPCRQVARMIGPRCSSGTPIRWRQIARRQAEARRRLEEMMRQRRGI